VVVLPAVAVICEGGIVATGLCTTVGVKIPVGEGVGVVLPPPPPAGVVGVVGVTVGVVGVEIVFETMTVTVPEVVVLPPESRATAVIVCVPFETPMVFQEPEYGAVVSSDERFVPSSLNWTPITPMLSEAEAERVTVFERVERFVGEVREIEGGVRSEGLPPLPMYS
jgi:hypothetical protein